MQATFTSFQFFCFFGIILLLYYLIPKKTQWVFLLGISVIYYLLTGSGLLILYPIAVCLAAYVGIHVMAGTDDTRRRRIALWLTVAVLLGILVVLKYVNFGINIVNGLAAVFGAKEGIVKGLGLLAPLGISFYTFSVLSYVIDVYNGIAKPQNNFAKLSLYGLFFPVILSGPILRYREDGEQFFEPHAFDYRQVTFGLQRMLWGLFKTLVISERIKLIVNTVYGDYIAYPGFYIMLATVCFAFQLYTNFSGGMDLALGMSQCFGLKLPENFETPFFARSISEYWRRWHITLGVWMKEYVFYPLLRTETFAKFGSKLRKKYGKKRGKQFTTFAGMFLLWLTVGIWHGGAFKFIVGSGLLHWFYIVSGELLTPLWDRLKALCRLGADNLILKGWQQLRTFFLVCGGLVFFRAESFRESFRLFGVMFSTWNPQIFWNGSLLDLGLDLPDIVVTILSLFVLLIVSSLQQKSEVRELIARKNIVVRWTIWYVLLFSVILFGCYGPGYSAAEFIYQGF